MIRQKWLIDPMAAEAFLPLIESYLQGKFTKKTWLADDDADAEEEGVERFCSFISPDGSMIRTNDMNQVPDGSVAVMSINGPLMKDDFCGDPGMDSMSAILQDWIDSDNICGIVIKGNSPGGTVAGTESFGNTIAGSSKPIISYIDGMAFSGMYWLSSQSDHIMAAGESSDFGSIGVMVSLNDTRKMYKKAGVTQHYINATTSPDKNKAALEARDGNYALVQEDLDATHAIFKDKIKSKRPDVKDGAMTGKMYMAKKAKKQGLIDSIGSFQEAVAMARGMAAKPPQDTNNPSTKPNKNDPMGDGGQDSTLTNDDHIMSIFSFKKKKAGALALSPDTEEVSAEEVQKRIDDLQADYTALEEKHREAVQARDNYQTELNRLTAEVKEVQGDAKTLKEAFEAKDAKIAELEELPAVQRGKTIGTFSKEEADKLKKAQEEMPAGMDLKSDHYQTAMKYGIEP